MRKMNERKKERTKERTKKNWKNKSDSLRITSRAPWSRVTTTSWRAAWTRWRGLCNICAFVLYVFVCFSFLFSFVSICSFHFSYVYLLFIIIIIITTTIIRVLVAHLQVHAELVQSPAVRPAVYVCRQLFFLKWKKKNASTTPRVTLWATTWPPRGEGRSSLIQKHAKSRTVILNHTKWSNHCLLLM
jgi:hypothetical protein